MTKADPVLASMELRLVEESQMVINTIKKNKEGTSLAVQWLRLHLPVQGVRVRSLVGELRSHMLRGQKKTPKKH